MHPLWSVAVFAHNEERRIAATLQALLVAAGGHPLDIVVLANGCTDNTVAAVNALALPGVRVVQLDLADKAEAWNCFVHSAAPAVSAAGGGMYVFLDGDVQAAPLALPALAAVLDAHPDALAAGALPLTGRDQSAWRDRMLASGTLAGGLYALRAGFVDRLRSRGIHLPRGLIGEDWLVSLLAHSDLQPLQGAQQPSPKVVFAEQAGFSFQSLSPWRLHDYRSYLRRLWRYALRGVQFDMVCNWLWQQVPEALPANMEQLYRFTLPPSRLKWVGWRTPLRLWAVLQIRRQRAQAHQALSPQKPR